MRYDDTYRESPDYFGEPAEVLTKNFHLIGTSRPVLDIGAGQGRHTLFLARKGYKVDAIDPSSVGLETISSVAEQENLWVRTFHTGFEDFVPADAPYSAILAFGVIQVISREMIETLTRNINYWIAPGGHVFVTAFSIHDPSYKRARAECREIGRHSFQCDSEGGRFRTYLEPDELPRLFNGYTIIEHRAEQSPVHQHGDDPPHSHAALIGIFRK